MKLKKHQKNCKNGFEKKIFVLKFYFATIFSARQHFYEKREGSILVTNGSGSGSPNKYTDPDADPDPEV
jgi:hypothetical protein